MVEYIADCMWPAEEESEEDVAQHVHGDTSAELDVEEMEVVVYEG